MLARRVVRQVMRFAVKQAPFPKLAYLGMVMHHGGISCRSQGQRGQQRRHPCKSSMHHSLPSVSDHRTGR